MLVRLNHPNQPINLYSQHINGRPLVLYQILHPPNHISQGPSIYQLVKCLVFFFGQLVNGPKNSLNDLKILRLCVVLYVLVQFSLLVTEQLHLIARHIMTALVDLRNLGLRVQIHSLCLFGQILQQMIPNLQQIMRIHPGILQHLLTQRSLPPIGQLILLINGHITVMMQQVGIGKLWIPKHSRCLVCVKQVDNVNVEISLEPFGVHLRAVHYFDDILVLDYLLEERNVLP
jgi:hypothetical protein